VIKPTVIGNPVGQFAFVPDQIPRYIPWRDENYKNKLNIYAYGIYERESYRVVCTVRHRADIERSMNVYIHHLECNMDNCLSDIIDQTCQRSFGQRLSTSKATRINDFETQFASLESQKILDPATGHQYVCCYEQKGSVELAKALTALARRRESTKLSFITVLLSFVSGNRTMFTVKKPEFGLVTGDVLTYRCTGHDLVYDDLRMIYNDGSLTYERNRFDPEWRLIGTNQPRQVDIDWLSPTRFVECI
jgi:hypothetical protein